MTDKTPSPEMEPKKWRGFILTIAEAEAMERVVVAAQAYVSHGDGPGPLDEVMESWRELSAALSDLAKIREKSK